MKQMRCAIYTRVSTEHGLEQEFNSLDAQREASEAYVKSQAHEGWLLMPDYYDDGGFSGGSMERPALQELLKKIRERAIDIVVVYKVDRLTRSLADFARLVELFDEHNVSFVSVTQAFNTTTSMGRLTLNVLLSFAQFEREVTGERIRDKIAASKRKGLWMGGVVPIGYRVEDRALIEDVEAADLVRFLYQRYLAVKSVGALKAELDADHVQAPLRQTVAGKEIGGKPFRHGHLYKILSNPVYIGEVIHKGKTHPGQHRPIIDKSLWGRVQKQLAEQVNRSKTRPHGQEMLLAGKLYDDAGNRMTPSTVRRGNQSWRYYVSQAVLQHEENKAGTVKRVSASALEKAVMEALIPHLSKGQEPERVRNILDRVTLGENLKIETILPDVCGIAIIVEASWAPPPTRRYREILHCEGDDVDSNRPMRTEAHGRLVSVLGKAHRWLDELSRQQVQDTHGIAEREGCTERSVRQILSLAFVAPDIIHAALERRLPRGFGMSRLTGLPMDWSEQRRVLGLPETSTS